MTGTIAVVAASGQVPVEAATAVDQQQLLVQAREQGVELVSPGGC